MDLLSPVKNLVKTYGDSTSKGLYNPEYHRPAHIKSAAVEMIDWTWGTVQGCFNEKMTVSQIIVDALIGCIPLVGDVTAIRDLLAVLIHMVKFPEKRKEVAEWVLLVILLLALIPVGGGVLKGVGRLLNRGAKTAAESRGLLKEIVLFLNRVGSGNAVKFIRELNLTAHQWTLVAKFQGVMDRLIQAIEKIQGSFKLLPAPVLDKLAWLRQGFQEIRQLGREMIPKAVKDLNQKLKNVQAAIYEGEWRAISGQGKAMTREAEARLVSKRAKELGRRKMKFPQNAAGKNQETEIAKVYQHREGWPNLMKKLSEDGVYEGIQAFSGPINATRIRGPYSMERYYDLSKAGPSGAWWQPQGTIYRRAKDWRERSAVLDTFNKDGYRATCHLPPNLELCAWEGKAAGQVHPATGQWLEGGGQQLVAHIPLKPGESEAILKAAQEAIRTGSSEYRASNGVLFKFEKTGWADSVDIHGFENFREVYDAETNTLLEYERAYKVILAGERIEYRAEPQR
ncbi:hypothetical protein [Holophaga foetida]|uniref:hypothetical protein n=1 Tax=Holophaga foetida TaxID=35839 RepID=UPI00024745F6|nr:hypothetical protein [Holophaga foetida]